ncbi:MAG: cupin domain-containing protein [Myxococcales bacterium]|nr:cupin domain-containing protein [Myxococcales bacterium]
MLERDGGEVARATSVVRYAPDSRFPPHRHDMGEEFLVLEGTFADEHGSYPAGTYVRNPPGTSHAPFTDEGCTIFVKLRQMPPGERVVRGPEVEHLHADERGVTVVRTRITDRALDDRGHELLLLEGTLELDGQRLVAPAWCRIPAGRTARCVGDALVWLKSGHLDDPGVLPVP